MKNFTKRILKGAAESLYRCQHIFSPSPQIMLTFMFHNFFNNEQEIGFNERHPLEKLTLADFRFFVEHFLESNYHFVTPDCIINNDVQHKKNIMLTFDDGYFSTLQILPVLEEYNIPGVFFVSIKNIKEGKLFWWDVLFKERRREGQSVKQIFQEEKMLQSFQNAQIEDYIANEFGESSFFKGSVLSRPLSVSELKDLSTHNLVTIGNHAVDHIRLSMCSDQEIQFQIETAQKSLEEITGYLPQVISYPHGAYDERVLSVSRQAGLRMGVTVEQRYDLLPFSLDENDIMKLGRFFFSGGENYPKDFDIYRPELQQYYKINIYKNRMLKKIVN